MRKSQHERHQYIYKQKKGLQPLKEHKYTKEVTFTSMLLLWSEIRKWSLSVERDHRWLWTSAGQRSEVSLERLFDKLCHLAKKESGACSWKGHDRHLPNKNRCDDDALASPSCYPKGCQKIRNKSRSDNAKPLMSAVAPSARICRCVDMLWWIKSFF